MSKIFICASCKNRYTSKVTFYRHVCHGKPKVLHKHQKKSKISASDNELFKQLQSCRSRNSLNSKFKSVNEFHKWRLSEEQKYFSHFQMINKTGNRLYFLCHFENKKRIKKSKCFSNILATILPSGVVIVSYHPVHDHVIDLSGVPFDQFHTLTIDFIKDLISDGLSPQVLNLVLLGSVPEPDANKIMRHPNCKKFNIAFNYLDQNLDLGTKLTHHEWMLQPNQNKQVRKLSGTMWSVDLVNNYNNDVIDNVCVQQIYSECPQPENCNYQCSYSVCKNLCSHLYKCSCRRKDQKICAHIHGVRSSSFNPNSKVCLKKYDIEFIGRFIKHLFNGTSDDPRINNYRLKFEAEPVISSMFELTPFKLNDTSIITNYESTFTYEDENRWIGKKLLNSVTVAYSEADPKILPDVNALLKNILEMCATSKASNIPIIKPFTPSLDNVEDTKDLTKPLFSVGSSSINMLSLKCLDYSINDKEIMILKKVDPSFTKGWIYDSIIDGFIERILQPEFSFLSSSVAQLVLSTSVSSDHGIRFETDKCILIPYNYDSCHWVLLNVNMKSKSIYVYDPSSTLTNDNVVIVNNLLIHLKALNVEKAKGEIKNQKEWNVEFPNTSKQRDDYNCGVFICWYCERIMKKLNLVEGINPFEYREKIYSTVVGKYPINNWLEPSKSQLAKTPS